MLNRTSFAVSALVALGILSFASAASAGTGTAGSCTEGRCSTSSSALKLDGKDPLFTTIDTGWMPSCDNGQEHCNKGLQVRAGLAFTAAVKGGDLFTAELGPSAAVQASWEDLGYLVLRSDSVGKDSKLSVQHSIAPAIDLFVDVGPIEQNFAWSSNDLMNKLPGAHFDYVASGSAPFDGWGFAGAQVAVTAPALPNSQLFSIDLSALKADKIMRGVMAINARTSPTFTYKTTKIAVDGKPILPGTAIQIPFPQGDLDYIDLPADIEGTMSAKGEIEVLPSVTLSQLGDMNFSPAMAVTFSSVKVSKAFDTPPQTYKFPNKTIHIPLPNMKTPREGLDGAEVGVGGQGTIAAMIENTGEAQGQVTLESSDPRFIVPNGPVLIGPKSKGALNIGFKPDGLGRAEATITAHTNDPDSPTLTFKVSAQGIEGDELGGGSGGKKGKGGDDDDDGVLSDVADGCGCRTAGTSSSSAYAGLGGLALALGAVLRRRRR